MTLGQRAVNLINCTQFLPTNLNVLVVSRKCKVVKMLLFDKCESFAVSVLRGQFRKRSENDPLTHACLFGSLPAFRLIQIFVLQ